MPKKKQPEKAKEDKFAALFLSLSIILLAFFILLNSIAELEASRVDRALRSLQALSAGLGVFGQGVSVDVSSDRPPVDMSKPQVFEKAYEMMQKSLTKWGRDMNAIDAYEDERRLVITMQSTALFSSGSNALHPRTFAFLDDIGELVERLQTPITVQGHSDSTPSSGKFSNWELAAFRANEVARYLLEGVGVPDVLVEAESFGDTRPMTTNDTEEGRRKNRRVDLVFYKRDLARLQIVGGE